MPKESEINRLSKEVRIMRQKIDNQDLRMIAGQLIARLEESLTKYRGDASGNNTATKSYREGQANGFHFALERVKNHLEKAIGCEGEEWNGKNETKSI